MFLFKTNITYNTKCQCHRTIFSIANPTKHQLTIYDIEDSIVTTRQMSRESRRDYMYSHGIDYDRVEQYYDIVCKLERLYTMPDKKDNINITKALVYFFSVFWVYLWEARN